MRLDNIYFVVDDLPWATIKFPSCLVEPDGKPKFKYKEESDDKIFPGWRASIAAVVDCLAVCRLDPDASPHVIATVAYFEALCRGYGSEWAETTEVLVTQTR